MAISRTGKSKVIRSVGAFLLAVLSTYALGALFATWHVLGRLAEMGMGVDFGVPVHAMLHDLIGMFPTYLPLVGVAFLVALPVIVLLARLLPGWRRVAYVSGFAVAMIALHLVMPMVLNVHPVAATRTLAGLLAQGLAGAVGGYLFYVVGRSREVESAGV